MAKRLAGNRRRNPGLPTGLPHPLANLIGMLACVLLSAAQGKAAPPMVFSGADVLVRASKSPSGEWIEEIAAKDAKGVFRTILVTPTHGALRLAVAKSSVTALNRPGSGLFDAPPTLALNQALLTPWVEGGQLMGQILTLTRQDNGATLKKVLWLPFSGRRIRVEQTVVFPKISNPIRFFVSSYAFAPDAKPLSKGGKPDSTFSPGLRPKDDQVVGDHFFRAPVISAQKGPLAALMLPDLDVLNENRPLPTILDLDAKNGVVDGTLMSYGFADHRLVGHVYYNTDASMVRKAPKELKLAYDLIVNGQAEPFGAYREALPFQWAKYGKPMFDRVLPQVMPFAAYAEYCYPAAFSESYGANKLGWFEVDIDGVRCGGIPSGWGFQQGWVSWQSWFNQLRSAWGLRWFGKKLSHPDWVDKADKMLNLALAAPVDRGAAPTTYQSREKQWKGSLITPAPECYYDLTNLAWKGIWLLRWLEFDDCPRREEIDRQTSDMARLFVRFQNADGSYPSWLSKDFKVVPILDHSAQSALPAWFLAEAMKDYAEETRRTRLYTVPDNGPYRPGSALRVQLGPGLLKAADFLVAKVVDQQRWYDFETFFSCSPKKCLQVNGRLDDPAMHDLHTLSPSQNTLCMQWAAEALFAVSNLLKPEAGARYRSAALKALDIMALYQNVSNLEYRKSAYIFGGFGVQNSDGEYLDARQAQFGATLADFGAALGRRDYFERGVAATRASMTLINHPLHAQNGLYPNPNYPPGLQPENVAHGGSDHQAGRTGFDWGEGSGLASMAWLLHRYGSTYQTKNWSVIVDGGISGQKHFPKPPAPLQDPAFDFSNWRMPGWTIEGNFNEVPTFSERFDFGIPAGEGFIGTCENGHGGYDDSYTGTLTSPVFQASKPKLRLFVGGGNGEGVFVELLVAESGSSNGTWRRAYVERGLNSERMREVAWDLAPLKGKLLKIRIVDRETGGWGHINVARIRTTD